MYLLTVYTDFNNSAGHIDKVFDNEITNSIKIKLVVFELKPRTMDVFIEHFSSLIGISE